RLDRMKESVFLTARATAMVCWLFVGSWAFSSVFSYLGGHEVVEEFMLGLDLGPVGFLILTQLIIFLLGWPLEWTEIIIIFVPIFLPLLPHYGIDPLFFGLLVALNIQTSFNSPPMAMAAYYLKGVAPPHIKLTEIFAGCIPFVGLVLVAMVLLYMFPAIGLWLPDYLYEGGGGSYTIGTDPSATGGDTGQPPIPMDEDGGGGMPPIPQGGGLPPIPFPQ
ncbi:MAG: TRAP transporter large permease subunit, partial [Pseudomonadota bacterium]